MSEERAHLGVLDGWRGISILLVLAGHLVPLGPKTLRLNEAAGSMGMAVFFTLSGFLITRFLLDRPRVVDFMIRRALRIVPLAWLALTIALPLTATRPDWYLPNFLFYANLPPYPLPQVVSHFWSLCVEVQFYAGIALVVAIFGVRGLMLLPPICLLITGLRAAHGAEVDITTWYRVDEILVGGVLALLHAKRLDPGPIGRLLRVNPLAWMALLMVGSHPDSGFMNYLRPYAAACLVGSTLCHPSPRVAAVLRGSALRYLASISFALYVFHGLLMHSWLGEGERLVKYVKRPLLFAATFALAHVSTFHYEQRWIALGRRWTGERHGVGAG